MLAKIIFVGLILVVLITPIPYGTVEPWWKAVFICAVLGIFILGIFENGNFLNPCPPVLPLLALSCFAFLQSWTRISTDPFQTRFVALQLLALTAFLALLYRYAANESRVRVLVYAIFAIAITSAIFGLLRQTIQHDNGFILPLLKPNQGFAQFVNKNHFAYLMEMALGLGLGLLVAGRSSQKLFLIALLLPVWIALVLSNSRGGIIAMTAQLLIATLFLLKWHTLRIATAGVLLAGVLAGTLWVGGERLVTNLGAAGSELTANSAFASDGAVREPSCDGTPAHANKARVAKSVRCRMKNSGGRNVALPPETNWSYCFLGSGSEHVAASVFGLTAASDGTPQSFGQLCAVSPHCGTHCPSPHLPQRATAAFVCGAQSAGQVLSFSHERAQ